MNVEQLGIIYSKHSLKTVNMYKYATIDFNFFSHLLSLCFLLIFVCLTVKNVEFRIYWCYHTCYSPHKSISIKNLRTHTSFCKWVKIYHFSPLNNSHFCDFMLKRRIQLIPQGMVNNNQGPDRFPGQRALDTNHCK